MYLSTMWSFRQIRLVSFQGIVNLRSHDCIFFALIDCCALAYRVLTWSQCFNRMSCSMIGRAEVKAVHECASENNATTARLF